MSHIESGLLQSRVNKGTSSSNHRHTSQGVSKVGIKDKDKKKESRSKPGFSGKDNQTQKSEYDSMFESKDGKTYRKPKTLMSAEMSDLAKQRKELIDAQLKVRQEHFQKVQKDAIENKPISDSTNKLESSREKSSDSNRIGMTSQMDQDQSRRSENDASEDDRAKRRSKKHNAKKDAHAEDPESIVFISLAETETTLILHIPSMIVPNDNKELLENQKIENRKYEKLLTEKAVDNFTNHATQVLHMPLKSKQVMTEIYTRNEETKTFMTEVQPYDITREMAVEEKKPLDILSNDMKTTIDREFEDKMKDPRGLLPTDLKSIELNNKPQPYHKPEGKERGGNRAALTGGQTELLNPSDTRMKATMNLRGGETTAHFDGLQGGYTESNKSKPLPVNTAVIAEKVKEFKDSLEHENKHLVMTEEEYRLENSEKLHQNLKFAKRILNQKKFHKEYVTYRNYPEIDLEVGRREGGGLLNIGGKKLAEKAEEERLAQSKMNLNLLFNFQHPSLQDRTVSSMDWNPTNHDLLAATYGEFDLLPRAREDKPLDKLLDGYVAFWTLKSPDDPERIIKTASRAMTCKFSPRNPNLIGVGFYDGIVAIYDIRIAGDVPVADSKELDMKHLDAVWDVNWVGKTNSNEKGEGLVSISSDGKIIEWSVKKGLESQELKLLNRVTNPTLKSDNTDTINFRYTTGFSLNFLPGDNNIYFVSTEDGTVHRCSKSYKEQYLDNYFGHAGPVYKVRCNPFWSDIFLTCSADWTCRLWNWREEQAKSVLRNLNLFDEVYDIEWSPYCSTMFASTARDGRLEIWDLAERSLDPIYVDWYGKNEHDGRRSYPARTCLRFNSQDPVVVSGNVEGQISVYRLKGYENCSAANREAQALALQKTLYPNGYNKASVQENL